MPYQKIFCTFGDSRMRKRGGALARLARQAVSLQVYDQIYIYDETSLEPQFYQHFQAKLNSQTSGFGYWCWKPQIIWQALQKIQDGDILHYTDAGCHLNKRGLKRLQDYFALAKVSATGILAFQAALNAEDKKLVPQDWLEKSYTKGDVFDYFEARERKDIADTGQIIATTMFIKKCPLSLKIIQEWLQVFYSDFALVDDSPSLAANFDGFISHRHDQSLWSILCKLNDVTVISAAEVEQFDNWGGLKYYPILAVRDRNLQQHVKYILKRLLQQVLPENFYKQLKKIARN